MRTVLHITLTMLPVFAGTATAQNLRSFVDSETPPLVDTYKDIHAHPELSHGEARTSGILAAAMREAGFTATERVGRYPDGSQAYGVVGILKNGAGPTLMIRADMDALPIVEETGLPYASHVTAKSADGQTVGVMLACGHDVHTTVLIGTARAMAAMKSQWHGTLMLVGQPSEETLDGAKAMLADHLYERFGRPDRIIGLHDTSYLAAGTVGIRSGPIYASSTSIDVVIRGIGSHGASPQSGRDPIMLAALYIAQIQTIVSREEDPEDPTVITVGSIHGGTKRNIIPDTVKLELTTRSYTDKSRNTVIQGLKEMAAGVTASAGLPPDRAATVTVLEDESAPVLYNDPAQTEVVKATLVKTFGSEKVIDIPRKMGSEDVGVFALPNHEIPLTYFDLGAMDPTKLAAAKAAGKLLPGAHTSRFEPLPEPTLRTGVTAMTAVALSLLQ
jgi:hippurate hydrolase